MKNTITLLLCLFCFNLSRAQSTTSFHNLSATLLDGTPIQMSQYYGKKLMVVNVASFCAYTPQYEQLENIYQQYRSNNFEIIGLPCNDYARQGGSDSEIVDICSTYNVTFPITQTVSIENSPVHPVFEWLTLRSLNGVSDANVTWNFNKFLIDEAGNWVRHYTQNTLPDNPAIIQWILSPSVLSSTSEIQTEQSLQLISSNPASDFLELQQTQNGASGGFFEMISSEGKTVKLVSVSDSPNFRIDVTDLSTGIYTGKWKTSDGLSTMRLLIAR